MNIEKIIQKYKITPNKDEFKDIPHTLHGKILLERLYDKDNNFLGYIVISEENFRKIYLDPQHDFVKSGHGKYRDKFMKEFP